MARGLTGDTRTVYEDAMTVVECWNIQLLLYQRFALSYKCRVWERELRQLIRCLGGVWTACSGMTQEKDIGISWHCSETVSFDVVAHGGKLYGPGKRREYGISLPYREYLVSGVHGKPDVTRRGVSNPALRFSYL